MILWDPVIQTELILIQQVCTKHLKYALFYAYKIHQWAKQADILSVYILSGADRQTMHKWSHPW